VPEVERKTQANDPTTGDAQFGWANGEIILGGGASDLIRGEGGDDIIDGDSSLKVNIETPNPIVRVDPLNLEFFATQAALNAAIAARQDSLVAFVLADAVAQLSTDALAQLLANLTGEQAADLLVVAEA